MKIPAIAIRAASKIWMTEGRPPVEALRHIDLDVARGEFLVLLGPSGCGKSTLLYMIAGLEATTSGSILCDGIAVAEPSAERGLIFQEAALYPWLTLVDNVAFGLSIRGESVLRRR